MKTWIHVTLGYRVIAANDSCAFEIIRQLFPNSMQYHWRDLTNHPAVAATFITREQCT